MKWQWIILCMYVLIVSFVPCGGDDECTYKSIAATENNIPRSDDHGDKDHCPPFCSCYCCQLPFPAEVNLSAHLTIPDHVLPGQLAGEIPRAFLSAYCKGIWQPPKK